LRGNSENHERSFGNCWCVRGIPNANLGLVYWRDKELALNKLPRFSMFWEILWELYELNFYLELSSLDKCANRDLVKENPASRIKCLWSCFPPSSFHHDTVYEYQSCHQRPERVGPFCLGPCECDVLLGGVKARGLQVSAPPC